MKEGTECSMESSISRVDYCAKKGWGGGQKAKDKTGTNYIVRKNVNFLIGDDIYFKCAMTAGNLSG